MIAVLPERVEVQFYTEDWSHQMFKDVILL